jgi:hypothetical protein
MLSASAGRCMDKEPVRIRDATADLKEFAMREYGMDPLAIAIESDISPDGTYSSGWLVSDGTAIAVIRLQGASFFPEARLELASLRGIQVREFSGCGSLEVMSSEGSRELLRFSSSRVAKFEAAAEALSSALDAAGAGDADREDSHEPAGEAMSPTARPEAWPEDEVPVAACVICRSLPQIGCSLKRPDAGRLSAPAHTSVFHQNAC